MALRVLLQLTCYDLHGSSEPSAWSKAAQNSWDYAPSSTRLIRCRMRTSQPKSSLTHLCIHEGFNSDACGKLWKKQQMPQQSINICERLRVLSSAWLGEIENALRLVIYCQHQRPKASVSSVRCFIEAAPVDKPSSMRPGESSDPLAWYKNVGLGYTLLDRLWIPKLGKGKVSNQHIQREHQET